MPFLVVLWAVSAPSSADVDDAERPVCDECGGGGVDPEQPAITAEAHTFGPGGGTTHPIPVGSSYLAGCTFDFVPTGDDAYLHPSTGGIVRFTEDYWVVFCPSPGPTVAYTYYPDGDPPPADVISQMVNDAYARTPVVRFNPITSPDGDDAIMLITRLETFLWVDETAWAAPVSAVASIPGFSVTTTAEAELANWSGGEDDITCTAADMRPYEFGIGGDDSQSSTCTMVYNQSSALQENTVDLSVTWDVNYTCSIPTACGGPLPDLTTNSTRVVVVGEIQAIGTS